MTKSRALTVLLQDATERCSARLANYIPAHESAEVQTIADELDRSDPWLGYRHIPINVRHALDQTETRYGEAGSSERLRLLLLHYIRQFEVRFASAGLPASFVDQFAAVFERIARQCQEGILGSSLNNDVFLKDLGVVRLRLIPCVSHLLYLHSGIPRRVVLKHPSILRTMLRMGGRQPLVENHVHPLMLDHFTEAGREHCYVLLGELLRLRSDLRGLMGSSWYYDPKLGRISPKLAYLHDVPTKHGAKVVPLEREGPDSGALARSSHRRKLHEAGAYTPHTYLMLWSRDDVLDYINSRI